MSLLVNSPLLEGIISETLGTSMIGMMVATALYGVTHTQTIVYLNHSDSKSQIMRFLVAIMWVLGTLHIVLILHAEYFYVVTQYGNVLELSKSVWSISLNVITTSMSNVLVMFISAYRVWRFSKGNWILSGTICVLATTSLVASAIFSAVLFQEFFFSKIHQFSWLLYWGLGSAITSDLTVAFSLCYFLYQNRTGRKKTDSLLTVLMIYVFNAGLLTTVANISCLIAYRLRPNSYIFISIFFVLPKLYHCSLLATLNARDSLRGGGDHQGHDPMPFPPNATGRADFVRHTPSGSDSDYDLEAKSPPPEDQSAHIAVSVQTFIETKVDEEQVHWQATRPLPPLPIHMSDMVSFLPPLTPTPTPSSIEQ